MDNLFFVLSKILWLVISPDHFLVLVLLTGIFCFWKGWHYLSKLLLTFFGFWVLVITFVPIGQILLQPLENRFPTNPVLPDHIDGIIVLSGPEEIDKTLSRGQFQVGAGAERLTMFMALVRAYPEAKAVFTGGTGKLLGSEKGAADIVGDFFAQQGLDINRVQFEGKARNTYENARNTFDIIQPQPGENWVLITTAWHMPRSYGIFKKVGWDVIPYPVDYWSVRDLQFRLEPDFAYHLYVFKVAVKEWIGLAAYYLTGKTDTLFP